MNARKLSNPMARVVVGLIAMMITSLIMVAPGRAAETLDPTQGNYYFPFPDYLNKYCGAVKLAVVEDGGTVAMVSARTTCPGSGRGAKARNYLACWRVTFAADRYYILDRDQVLYVSWVFGDGTRNCPALD